MAFKCPFCNYEGVPHVTKQVSATGWLLFVLLLFVCFPLCWLPFVGDGCKEELKRCPACGCRTV